MKTLLAQVRGLVRRAIVTLIDDGPMLQRVQAQLLAGQVVDAERFQQYGFSAVPFNGAEALVLFVGAAANHPVVVALDDRRHRMRGLEPGEVCIYTDEGDYVIIRRGGAIEIKGASSVTISTPSVHLTGSLTVDGDAAISGNATIDGTSGLVVSSGDVAAGGIQLKTHHHSGVQAGGSLTGPPV